MYVFGFSCTPVVSISVISVGTDVSYCSYTVDYSFNVLDIKDNNTYLFKPRTTLVLLNQIYILFKIALLFRSLIPGNALAVPA